MSKLLNEIASAATAVLEGKVILYPTDTIWGIGCDASNEEAIGRIKNIKVRTADKSFIILVPTIREALKYIAMPPLDIESVFKQFDKPTTVIFDNAINLPASLLNEDGSIGIRIPKDDFCIQLLKKTNKPLVSTSANFTGQPTALTFEDIDELLIKKIDHVVDWKREDKESKSPSSIVKIYENGQLDYIRK